MKIQIMLKTPDCLESPCGKYVENLASKFWDSKEICDDYDGEIEYYREDMRQRFLSIMEKWFKYGECVTLEVDTELGTCTVLE